VQTWFIIGGIVTCVMGIAGVFVPAIMKFEDGRPAIQAVTEGRTSGLAREPVAEQASKVTTSASVNVDYT
jgi:hypothetical protein